MSLSTADEPLWTKSWLYLVPVGRRVLPRMDMKHNEFYNSLSRGIVVSTAIAMLWDRSYKPLLVGGPLLYLTVKRAGGTHKKAIEQQVEDTLIASNTLAHSDLARKEQGSLTSDLPRPGTVSASNAGQVYADGVQRNNLASYLVSNPTDYVESQKYMRNENPPRQTYAPSLEQIKFQNSRSHRAHNMNAMDESLFGFTRAGVAGKVSRKTPLGQPVLD